MQFFVSSKPSTTCCDSISRSVPDGSSAPQAAAAAAAAAASFCCPPACEKRLVSGARAELSAALGVYGSPYAPAHAYANYFQYGADSSAIYSTLVRTEINTKQGDTAPRSIDQACPCTIDHYSVFRTSSSPVLQLNMCGNRSKGRGTPFF